MIKILVFDYFEGESEYFKVDYTQSFYNDL